jgi:hypothetical protein
MLRTATQKGRLMLVVGSVAAAAAGAMVLRADLMVGYGFSKALGVQKPIPPFELAAPNALPGEVGDETYWLTRTLSQLPSLSHGRLAVGDRITVTGRNGRARDLEVVAITAVAAPLLKIAAGATPMPLLLVTCRVVDGAQPESRELVHFMIEAEVPKTEPLTGPQDPLGRT